MKPEINFFGDASIMSNADPFGSDRSQSNSQYGTGISQHRDDRNCMTRQMYSIARSHQEQFARRTQEIAMATQETQSIHRPILGLQQPAPAIGASPAVTMQMYLGGAAPLRFLDDVPFVSVWNNGVRVVHSYQMDMPNPIPSGEEHDLGMGTGLTTRNFLGAMEQKLNPNYSNLTLQLECPEPMMMTVPIIDLDPEEVDLELKL